MAEPAKPSTAGCSARRWHRTGHHRWGHPVVRGGPRQDTSTRTHVLLLGIATLRPAPALAPGNKPRSS